MKATVVIPYASHLQAEQELAGACTSAQTFLYAQITYIVSI